MAAMNISQFLLEVPMCDITYKVPLPPAVRAKWSAPPTRAGPSASDLETRMACAAARREELKQQMVQRIRRLASHRSIRTNNDNLAVLKRLKEKLIAAQLKREKELEAVRTRAASKSSPKASPKAMRDEEAAQKLRQSLEAADHRRQARLEAEKERLSAAHEKVMSRMVDFRSPSDHQKRDQLDSRLSKAEEARRERLAAVAEKAGDAVRHAREVVVNTRLAAEEEAQRQREQLLGKLAAAEQRRTTHRRWSTDSGSDVHVA